MFPTLCKFLFLFKLVCCRGTCTHAYTQALGCACGGQRVINVRKSFPTFQLIKTGSLLLLLCSVLQTSWPWALGRPPVSTSHPEVKSLGLQRLATTPGFPFSVGSEGWTWVHRMAWLVLVPTEWSLWLPGWSFPYRLVGGILSSQYHDFLVFPHLPACFELLIGRNEHLLFAWSSSVCEYWV